MGEQQLLVHINAPGTVHHDQRYREIAASLSTFEPATVTRVGRISYFPDRRWANQSLRMQDNLDALPATDANLSYKRETSLVNATGPVVPSPCVHSHEPSSCQRPGASLVGKPTIQVPATVLQKRARSLSASFHSTTSVVLGTHPRPRRPLTAPNPPQVFNDEAEEAGHAHDKLRSVTSGEHRRASKRMKLAFSGSSRASDAYRLNQSHGEVNLGGDSNSAYTGNSTMSPSQPVGQTCYSLLRDPATGKTPVGSDAFVDLTSQFESTVLSRQDIATTPTRTEKTGANSRYGKSMISTKGKHLRSPKASKDKFTVVQTALAPETATGFDKRAKIIPKGLSAVIERLPLTKHFKPKQAARCSKGSTRGYWELNVSTARLHVAPKAHEQTAKSNDLTVNGPSPEPSPQTGIYWTEQELSDIWAELKAFVTSGRGGTEIHAVKEAHRTASSAVVEQADTNRWRIRVFCWSEVLGHVWLILWVLSNKRTAKAAMRWVDVKGRTRVKMKGEDPTT